jgi:hypothetical protein
MYHKAATEWLVAIDDDQGADHIGPARNFINETSWPAVKLYRDGSYRLAQKVSCRCQSTPRRDISATKALPRLMES